MLFKTGTVCIGLVDPHLIFDRICVRTLQTHMRSLLPEDLVLTLKQVLSLCTITLLPSLFSACDMKINYTSRSTIDPDKQWFLVINIIVIRVKKFPPPPLCMLYHEHILCVIYHIFIQIIV